MSPSRGRRWPSLAIALGSATTLPGCSLDVLGPTDGSTGAEPVAEVHGKYVAASAGHYATVTWSPSGEEVAFISPDYRLAYAYHLRSGAMRQLDAAVMSTEQLRDITLSADGIEWFTTSVADPRAYSPVHVVRRHTSAGSTVLTDRGTIGADATLGQRGVLAGASQTVTAFIVQPDSLFLLRRGDQPAVLGRGCAGIVAFSADESQVLCVAGSGQPRFQTFRDDGGTAKPLVLPPAVRYPLWLRWDARGIQVLYGDGTSYLLYEEATGSSRLLAGVSLPSLSGTASWSGNGRKVAYWNDHCLRTNGAFIDPVCIENQAFLYVLDVATGATARVAVHNSSGSGRVALSPDGSMAAYTIDSGLYLLEVK